MASKIWLTEQKEKEQTEHKNKKDKEDEDNAVLWLYTSRIDDDDFSSGDSVCKEKALYYLSSLENRERRKKNEVHEIKMEIDGIESTLHSIGNELDEAEDGMRQYASMEKSSYGVIRNIASSINRHYTLEKRTNVSINAIARAEYDHNGHRNMCWVVNYLPERGMTSFYVDRSGFIHAEFGQLTAGKALESDGFTISKNTRMGEEIIQFNRFSYHTHICNRATWNVWNGIRNIAIDIAGDDRDYHFQTLESLLSQFRFDYELYDKKLKIKNELTKKRLELEAKLQQANQEYIEAHNDRKKAEEAISIIGEKDKMRADELRRKEIEKEKAEEQLRLKAEADKVKRENDAILQQLADIKEKLEDDEKQIITARSFIREDHSLRSQHILDPSQEKAKRSHFFDGTPVIIVGGPGTGKTTTIIQRLKFLISPEAFVDYNTKLSEENINELLNPSSIHSNWLFISPNEPLLLFLRENMRREGLLANVENTKTIDSLREDMFGRYKLTAENHSLTNLQNKKLAESCLFLHPYHVAKQLDTFIADQIVSELYNNLSLLEDIPNFNNIAIRLKKGVERRFATRTSIDILISMLFHLQVNEKDNIAKAIKGFEQDKNTVSTSQRTLFKYLRKITAGVGDNLIDRIPSCYIRFRENELHNEESNVYDSNTLNQIIKVNKFALSNEEQCFLLGFINNLFRRIPVYNKDVYKSLEKNKYKNEYEKNLKYVMTIDEATDYSPIEYYFMASFLNPKFSSLTMCGDLMQGLTLKGIKKWEDISHIVGGKDADIIELSTSYRQLPKLVDMARIMYKEELGVDAPFQSNKPFSDSDPAPLCFISLDENEKIMWLAARLQDIYLDYDKTMPSVGLFIGKADDAQEFTNKINEYKDLLGEISVVDCTNGREAEGSNVVRVFNIDEVKGMEFEVVLFHNIDSSLSVIDQGQRIIKRYLYVGISRATSHLAVTMSRRQGNEEIIKFFDTHQRKWR